MKSVTTNQPQRFPFGTFAAVAMTFFAVSLTSVPIPGFNEPHYICKARAAFEPEWCANDFFLQSRSAHVIYFAVTGWLLQFVTMPAAALTGRLISCVLLSTGWTQLGRRFGLNGASITLAAILFAGISQTGNLSGEWVIGGYESKVPSYGFALMGCAAWIACRSRIRMRDVVWAGACLGLAIGLHPVVGLWFLIGIGMCETWLLIAAVFTRNRQTHETEDQRADAETVVQTSGSCPLLVMKRGGILLVSAVLVSLPGLIPALKIVSSSAVSQKQKHLADFIQVFGRLKHHLDPSTFPRYVWIHSGILVAAILIFWFTLRRLQSGREDDSSTGDPALSISAIQRWLLLVLMAAVIAIVGIAVGWHTVPAKDIPLWETRAFLLKFYPFRFIDAMMPMSCAFLAAALVQRIVCGRNSNVAEQQWSGRSRTAIVSAIALLSVSTIALASYQRKDAPSAYSESDFLQWKAACRWIDQNTPASAVVLTPRESFAFKWFAERAEYVCYKDCPQDTAGILEWNRRLGAIHSWSYNAFQDGRFDNSDLVELRKKTGSTHLMTRKLGPFEDTPIYDDGIWRIYECPQAE